MLLPEIEEKGSPAHKFDIDNNSNKRKQEKIKNLQSSNTKH